MYQLERKEEEVKGLRERVEMLVDRLGEDSGDRGKCKDKDMGDEARWNCNNNGNGNGNKTKEKERTVSTNKKTPSQDNKTISQNTKIINTQKTINPNPKSPPPLTAIKSPPKPS